MKLFRFIIPTYVLFSLGAFHAFCADEVDFNRDIRPILSNNCYACHGPDEGTREAGLRLDDQESATSKLESGAVAVVPGDLVDSELIARITADDEDLVMPPPDSDKQLTEKQIETLKKWIKQGAPWGKHWSFVKPQKKTPPKVDAGYNVANPIDAFIIARVLQADLTPTETADKATLIRRLSLDLTGLPPTIAEVDAFLADESPGSYERLVDRLLTSQRFGEHQARYWLDAARYGDTHGLHLDNERGIWPFREWVMKAYNDNMPFDQFTIEQIAGDLLPNATVDQKIATGFNRCNITTGEGGTIAEEFRVRYAVDRVETTSTVWMGLTLGCAVCHDHKFDPFTQKEFYQLFAYFNNTADAALDGNTLLPPPFVRTPTPEHVQQVEALDAKIAKLQQQIQDALADFHYEEPAAPEVAVAGPHEFVWIEDALPTGANGQGNEQGNSWRFVSATDKHPVFSGERSTIREAPGLTQHFFTGASPQLQIGDDDVLFAYVYLDPANPPKEIMLQFNNGNWEHRAYWGDNAIDWGTDKSASRYFAGNLPELGKWTRLEIAAASVGLPGGSAINGWAFTQFDGKVYWDKAGIVTSTPQNGRQFESLLAWETSQRELKKPTLTGDVQAAIQIEAAKRNEAQAKLVRDYFLEHVYAQSRTVFDPLHQQLADAKKQKSEVENAFPASMILADQPGMRDAFVLMRGEYDKHGDKVKPGTPAALPPLPNDAPSNRLALAKWLVNRDHPLTARVIVNRIWQQYFGVGIVKTSEDFGSQGELPSHPDLLDWLAAEFMESGWNVKHIHKLIVMSATYRQSSRVTQDQQRIDPEGRLHARGPRFRLDAEVIRDSALYASGLLNESFGGKSVKPYQPEGLWKAVGFTGSNTAIFKQDQGDALYRRSVYTFWKRTAPPPTLTIFDAPSREACVVRRPRTNTPLQALVLLNDVQYVEAARRFAERIMKEGGESTEQRLVFAIRTVVARQPTAQELTIYKELLQDFQQDFRQDEQAAKQLISTGDSARDENLNAAEHAAWTMIANLLLNLNEGITKG